MDKLYIHKAAPVAIHEFWKITVKNKANYIQDTEFLPKYFLESAYMYQNKLLINLGEPNISQFWGK